MGAQGSQKKALDLWDFLALEVQAVVSCPTWMLRTALVLCHGAKYS